MSNDRQKPSHVSQTVNGTNREIAAATQLADLFHNLRSFNPSDPSSAQDVGQLLRSIEQADGIAQGIDSRLDTLLQDLEGMIGVLEAERAQGREPDVQERERIAEQEKAVEAELESVQSKDASSEPSSEKTER